MIYWSSFRSRPGWSQGMNRSIIAHRSSESQNRLAIVTCRPQTAARRHKLPSPAMTWFGSHPSAADRSVVQSAGSTMRLPCLDAHPSSPGLYRGVEAPVHVRERALVNAG